MEKKVIKFIITFIIKWAFAEQAVPDLNDLDEGNKTMKKARIL